MLRMRIMKKRAHYFGYFIFEHELPWISRMITTNETDIITIFWLDNQPIMDLTKSLLWEFKSYFLATYMRLRVCFKWHKKSQWWPLFDNSKYYKSQRQRNMCRRVKPVMAGDEEMLAKNAKWMANNHTLCLTAICMKVSTLIHSRVHFKPHSR